MAYNQSKNPFSKSPLNFSSPLNSFDSLVGKLMNQGKSKEAATKIAGKVANAKMKGAGSGPTAAQKARSKGSAAKMADESPLDKELVGKQKNLPEHLKAKIEAAPESPAKMKSPIKAHDKKLKALEKRIKRVRQSKEGSEGQGGIDYELLSQLEEQKKKLVEDHAKQAKETPDAKSSPAKHINKFMDKDHPHNREPKHSDTLHSHKDFKKKKESPAKMKDKKSGKSHGEMSKKELHNHGMVHHVAKKPDGKKKRPSRPEASKKTADLLNAKNPPNTKPKDSPANLKGVVKGVEKVAKIAKKAKIKQNAVSAIKQGKLAAMSGKAAIRSAIAGAAGYLAGKAGAKGDKRAKTGIISSKKKSPLNNAYENPEYFVPTKSSYGQDMDNFFNTVSNAYANTQTDENRLERATRISDKLAGKTNLSGRQKKRKSKFDTEKTRLTKKIGRSVNCPPGQTYDKTTGKCV